MLPKIASFVIIIIVEIQLFASVGADGIVIIKAYCTVEELDQPRPVYKHVRDQIENCEKLGYVQPIEVKAVKKGIYYVFTFELSQDSSNDIPKENKCMDYQDKEDKNLESLLIDYLKSKEEMIKSEKEYKKRLRDSDSDPLPLPLRLKALLSAYDEGKKQSGSKEEGEKAFINELENKHKNVYDPLLKEQQAFEEKQRLCATAKNAFDAYIKMMEEEKELVEYRKFYDDNGNDKQLEKLLKNYQDTREAKEKCLKNYLQMKSIPEMRGFLEFVNENLMNSERLCAKAKNALDVYITKMEEEKLKKGLMDSDIELSQVEMEKLKIEEQFHKIKDSNPELSNKIANILKIEIDEEEKGEEEKEEKENKEEAKGEEEKEEKEKKEEEKGKEEKEEKGKGRERERKRRE
ncbi:hypothetical protein niasHT_026662 [Heterodera trifolii]|uniref:Effector protein n=1 Tax=Heterodera trifolii TaxID=157864 RepID=A0ABD2JT35_9BILA